MTTDDESQSREETKVRKDGEILLAQKRRPISPLDQPQAQEYIQQLIMENREKCRNIRLMGCLAILREMQNRENNTK